MTCVVSVTVSEAESVMLGHHSYKNTFTKASVEATGVCSITVTDGDFKPSAQIHTWALALIFLTLLPINSASMFSVARVFLVSQLGLLVI